MLCISSRGLVFIKEFEGFSANKYICAAGFETVGYGHVVKRGELLELPISKENAHILLRHDVKIAERAVGRYIHTQLDQCQFDALVSFTFNLGAGALQRSSLRRKINRGEHDAAVHEFPKWVYAGGKKLAGLIRRRNAEALMYQGILEDF